MCALSCAPADTLLTIKWCISEDSFEKLRKAKKEVLKKQQGGV